MKRCFYLLNKEYSFEGLPKFPLTELAAEPTVKDWANLPAITSFRVRYSDDRAPAADFKVKYALAGNFIYVNAVCETYSDVDLPMRESYQGWTFDNSLELWFGTEKSFHQFLVNAAGAKYYAYNKTKGFSSLSC